MATGHTRNLPALFEPSLRIHGRRPLEQAQPVSDPRNHEQREEGNESSLEQSAEGQHRADACGKQRRAADGQADDAQADESRGPGDRAHPVPSRFEAQNRQIHETEAEPRTQVVRVGNADRLFQPDLVESLANEVR